MQFLNLQISCNKIKKWYFAFGKSSLILNKDIKQLYLISMGCIHEETESPCLLYTVNIIAKAKRDNLIINFKKIKKEA